MTKLLQLLTAIQASVFIDEGSVDKTSSPLGSRKTGFGNYRKIQFLVLSSCKGTHCQSIGDYCLVSSTHDYIHTRKCNDNLYIKFTKDQYDFAIDENSPIGSKIGVPITLDNFDQGYMLNVKGDDFTISPRTGQLYTRIELDFERHGQNQF